MPCAPEVVDYSSHIEIKKNFCTPRMGYRFRSSAPIGQAQDLSIPKFIVATVTYKIITIKQKE